MHILSNIVSSFLATYASVYNLHKLLNKKINYKSIKFCVLFIILMIIAILNYFNINLYIRIIIITISLMIFCKLLFKFNLKITVMASIYSQLITMLAEFIYILFISIIFLFDEDTLINNIFGTVITNFSVCLFSIMIVNIKYVQRFHKFLIDSIEKIKLNYFIALSGFTLLIMNVLSMTAYYDLNYKYILIFNTITMSLIFIIVIYSFNTKNQYIKVFNKYNTTLNSLKEYEDILDKYRISNHENKNELLTIRNMLPKTNKKIILYIDKIIENKQTDNEKIIKETSIIPAGGLRGLIYSKLLLMNDLNINYNLSISNNVKTIDFISLDDSLMLNICKIIGVFIDNGIDEVRELNKKHISIEMYMEQKELIIKISNNYKGNIELDKINNTGYTTKEKGRGYGLTLVKQIIDNNFRLKNQTKITKEIFSQILKIKM